MKVGGMVQEARLFHHTKVSKSFCKSQFPYKFVKLFFMLMIVQNKLTDLGGGGLLQNNFKTLCEISSGVFVQHAAGTFGAGESHDCCTISGFDS